MGSPLGKIYLLALLYFYEHLNGGIIMNQYLENLYNWETDQAHLDFGRDGEYQSSLSQAETLWPSAGYDAAFDGRRDEPLRCADRLQDKRSRL